MQKSIDEILQENNAYLKEHFGLNVDEFLSIMGNAGPSNVFKKKHPDYNWKPDNPTEGWCAQLNRFLKDFNHLPKGFQVFKNNNGLHYYLYDGKNTIIDLTIYQFSGKQSINYDCKHAKFNPVPNKSTKDAINLSRLFPTTSSHG